MRGGSCGPWPIGLAFWAALVASPGAAWAAPAAPEAEPPVAPAVAVGADEVQLENGGMVRGTVVEIEPGQHVVIVVGGTDERRVIPWSEVREIERGKHGPGVDGAPAPGDAAAPRPEGPRLHVEVRGGREVVVHEVTSTTVGGGPTGAISGVTFRPVCRAPCDQVIDGADGRSFFVAGPGVTPSRRFTLAGHSEDVTLRVRPGRAALHWVGWAALAVGVGGAVAGVALLSSESGSTPAGWSLVGAGTSVVVGGVLMVVFGSTRLELVAGGRPLPT